MRLIPKFLLSLMLMINGVAISAAKNSQEDDYTFPILLRINDKSVQGIQIAFEFEFEGSTMQVAQILPLVGDVKHGDVYQNSLPKEAHTILGINVNGGNLLKFSAEESVNVIQEKYIIEISKLQTVGQPAFTYRVLPPASGKSASEYPLLPCP